MTTMAIDSKLMTAEELAEMEPEEGLSELIRGEPVKMPPPGHRHGRLIMRIGNRLFMAVEVPGFGVVVSASGIIFSRRPDSVLAPDIAVFLGPSVAAIDDEERYLEKSPELVVEVVSPSDLARSVNAKINIYLEAGVQMVVVVWPEERKVSISTPNKLTKTLAENDRIDFDGIVPGYSPTVNEFLA